MNYANKGLGYSQKSPVLRYFHCTELRTEHINQKSHRRRCCAPARGWLCWNTYTADSRKTSQFWSTAHYLLPTVTLRRAGGRHNPIWTTPLDFSKKMSQWGWGNYTGGEFKICWKLTCLIIFRLNYESCHWWAWI